MSTHGSRDSRPPAKPPLLEEITAPSSPSARRATFALDWDRYELLDFLGKGGMGSVYRARDRRLDRIVAIKFVLDADPKTKARLLDEARAQSRIDHPNICRVLEVGEVEGRAYIALQLVRGEPLHRAAKQMTLDEKVTVLRDIAAAIHEAHRLGVVHRDLKPSNVLVERTSDGRWFPVVMDFGLARQLSVDLTASDAALVQGTPAYMSPEQARGDAGSVDRRSDVYSLGATLYELMTGQVPFTATSTAQVLTRLLHEDPPAPRTLTPNLPVDLEVIVLQCLAKDPTRRYASAKELADDLERYLDDTPIQGRRPSAWHRTRAHVRHHPVLTAVCAMSLAFVAVGSTINIRAWVRVRNEQERSLRLACLVQRVARQAAEIESSLREASLRPLHDVRPDRQRARALLREIAGALHDPADPDSAHVHAALGRGYLALHEWREAVAEFQAAHRAGLDTPDTHTALGRALGELYFRSLGEVGRPDDEKEPTSWLSSRHADLTRKYLTPAHQEIELSGEKNPLARIRIALYSQDFTATEQQAREIASEDPDSLEAREIAGKAALLAATEAFDRGDYDAALPTLERAASTYTQASLIARSDGTLYRSAAEAWLQVAEIEHRRHRSPTASLQQALDLLERGALVTDPDDSAALVTRTYVLLRRYRSAATATPKEDLAALEQIVASAAHAVASAPREAPALCALGIAYIYRGNFEFFHGGQGSSWWQLAVSRLETALAIQPDDPRVSNALGLAHRWLGDALDKAGQDPSREYAAARKNYDRAISIVPRYFRACVNRTELSTLSAEHNTLIGRDPLSDVEEARRAGRACLAVDPASYATLDVLARAELALAQHLLEVGTDPGRALTDTRDFLVRSEIGLPDHAELWYQRGVAARIEAAYSQRRGEDPTEAISQGRRALDRALRLMPESARTRVEHVRLSLIEVEHSKKTSTVMTILDGAENDAESAVELDGSLPQARLVAAEVYLRAATTKQSLADSLVERGIVHADEAERLFPGIPGGKAVREALEQLRQR